MLEDTEPKEPPTKMGPEWISGDVAGLPGDAMVTDVPVTVCHCAWPCAAWGRMEIGCEAAVIVVIWTDVELQNGLAKLVQKLSRLSVRDVRWVTERTQTREYEQGFEYSTRRLCR